MNLDRTQLAVEPPTGVVIRLAGSEDSSKLERLSQLDSAARLQGTTLIAGQGELAVAAISLENGDTVADPFRHTADLVSLLRMRCQQLIRERRSGSRRLLAFSWRDGGATPMPVDSTA